MLSRKRSRRHPKQVRFQWFLLCQYLQTTFCWSRECRVKIWPVCWNKTLELSLSHRSQIFHFLPSHKSAELTTMTASKVLSSKAKKFPPIIMKSRAHIVTFYSKNQAHVKITKFQILFIFLAAKVEGDSGIPVTLGIHPKTRVKRRARLFEAWKNNDKREGEIILA